VRRRTSATDLWVVTGIGLSSSSGERSDPAQISVCESIFKQLIQTYEISTDSDNDDDDDDDSADDDDDSHDKTHDDHSSIDSSHNKGLGAGPLIAIIVALGKLLSSQVS
jgi:hypothetical protein